MSEQTKPQTTSTNPSAKSSKPKKIKAPKFNEKNELAQRTELLISLAPRIRKAESNLDDAAEAHKSAKAHLEIVQSEASKIIYELESIRKGTFQMSLPIPTPPAKPTAVAPTSFDKIDSELRLAAEDALASARAKKKGLSPSGLALLLFGGKRASKDQKARALEILTLMAAAGLIEKAESGKKEQVFLPVNPKDAPAVAPVIVTSANKGEALKDFSDL